MPPSPASLPAPGRGALVGLLLLLAVVLAGCRQQPTEWTLGSGPRGGTFENIAAGLGEIVNAGLDDSRVVVEWSGGSVDNLARVQQGELDMGLVFSGDAFLGREGRLKRNLAPTTSVLAMARLYSASAHLVVLSRSAIHSVSDLRGRRVAIGSGGTGSAQTARRYFESHGLWEAIIPIHLGYRIAIEDLADGNLDAVWMQVGYPSRYLLGASRELSLRLLDLDPAQNREFRTAFPFYSPATIPAGTYRGQDRPVHTFEDAALWVVNSRVEETFLARALQTIFSDRSLAQMHERHPAAWDMSRDKALQGVSIPLHPVAARFWKDLGLEPAEDDN